MRVGAGWNDVCILNICSRGLGLQSARAPERGSYVEVRRGPYVIVAKVAWSDGRRFGLRTQDPVPVDGIVNQPDQQATASTEPAASAAFERRQAPRTTRAKYEASRVISRLSEFACIAFFGACAAFAAFESVNEVLARPLSHVEASLSVD